ncbi:MAG: hypothetical protein AAF527_02720 [Pseudomonadota bacterium]
MTFDDCIISGQESASGSESRAVAVRAPAPSRSGSAKARRRQARAMGASQWDINTGCNGYSSPGARRLAITKTAARRYEDRQARIDAAEENETALGTHLNLTA